MKDKKESILEKRNLWKVLLACFAVMFFCNFMPIINVGYDGVGYNFSMWDTIRATDTIGKYSSDIGQYKIFFMLYLIIPLLGFVLLLIGHSRKRRTYLVSCLLAVVSTLLFVILFGIVNTIGKPGLLIIIAICAGIVATLGSFGGLINPKKDN